ncbi:UvrD-helicase domain-containing protein [Colwellia psychrerythraea]|uniref:RecBCD enzyme subunit RecB n=1 Tax=Colwellia psychrerythraea TaxID=28229 RepID=A0A099KRE9_COLPS|nr:UvrD-helicase domain-containing protein [Colwellia psychrerythraea]KGJ92795.1 Helicase superfamily 1 UvrD-related protein [Colwellia psychrerythraea]
MSKINTPELNKAPSEILTLKNLDAATIKLTGKHLIEASAGTGKTYNITRIYLRLLLERELTVEQILLMTFTKDATQELRGRIDVFIRLALSDWHILCVDDPFFAKLDERIEKTKREFLLKRALLFLDEAAIFTIHGFCQRVLSQYAFTSGLPFNANMAANSSEITLQVCQDWYRSLAKTDDDSFMLLASFWATPDSFLSSFSKAIGHTSSLSVIDVEHIEAEFVALVRLALENLTSNSDLFENALILVKKGADQDKRRSELAQLQSWLENIISKEISLMEVGQGTVKMPDGFFDGKRYARSTYKAELLAAFTPVKEVKEQVKKIANKLNKAKAYAIVKSGIYQIRQQVIEQKQALNLLDFDDLINTLAICLRGDSLRADSPRERSSKDGGSSNDSLSQDSSSDVKSKLLALQLLGQYPVALIDEFQDTDPKQFGILQSIYYGDNAKQANAGLFLIGDPKQAIYGFRGGDIFAYLNARNGCDYHWLMDTNWRSTPEVIAGYNQFFTYKRNESAQDNDALSEEPLLEELLPDKTRSQQGESVFGFGIPYSPVLAGKKSKEALSAQPAGEQVVQDSDKALQFIHFTHKENDDDTKPQGDKVSQGSRPILANWCANEIVTLLSSKVHTGETSSIGKVKPKDIAILVRDGAEARDIKHALQKAGLDSVFLSDRANLFHSEQAKQLLCLLKGVLLPENERLFVAALSCGLLGFNAQKLHLLQQDEIAYQTLKFAFVDYRSQWQRQGFITMAINLMHNLLDVPQNNKDRCLTNILHLFEILQAASVRLSQGQELLYWFEQQCQLETNDVEAELRLESDGDLIRLITQHGSKGMEYPYVFIPFATRHKDPLKFGNKSVSYLEYHDKKGDLCLSLDGSKEAKKAMSNEAYAESIRLLYVAITRAERRCYVLCCAFDAYHLSPLGKTLKIQDQESIIKPLQALKASAEHAIGIREVALDCPIESEAGPLLTSQRSKQHIPQFAVSKFVGKIERDWWLSSFTALSRNIRHAGVSNPDRDTDTVSIESNTIEANAIEIEALQSSEKICFKLAKGAHTGNLLHDILEHTDFSAPDWQESFEKPMLAYGDLNATIDTSFTEADLIGWLEDVLHAPFISKHITDDTSDDEPAACLADLASNQTLRESEFYFPMQGEGTNALANLLTDHRNSAKRSKTNIANGMSGGTLTSTLKYPVMLPSYKKLSGMMHGFIDLIFEYQGKYYLCDYKSSHLGDSFQDYQFDALLDNVEKNYYDLQYLIYSLALHRYLKQTLVNYDVKQHFGGVYYLYLRGMTTEPNHKGAGVYYRHISEQEINNLDALFSSETIAQPQINEGA